jgi:hypothetical protein
MDRLVQKRHGLYIRSGGYYFLYGRDYTGDDRTWTTALGSNGYSFDQINPQNVFVRTPAEQVLWEWAEDYGKVKPSAWARHWCNTNAPDWDHADPIEPMFAEFIFTHRKHAIALSRAIDDILAGIKSSS